VTADVVPAFAVFDAPSPGTYFVWTGNLTATPKAYDVSELRSQLASAPFHAAVFGAIARNPAYQPPQPLPQVSEEGSDIDVTPWHYRKKVSFDQAGIQRFELDLESLAHNESRLSALRLVRSGKQLPYVVDLAGVMREFSPALEAKPASGNTSHWEITLPFAGAPLSSLRFTVQEPLFQRTLALYEETQDERGDTVRQPLGGSTWTRLNGEMKDGFTISLYRAPRSRRLLLETSNGDNPPIHLLTVQGYYQAPRLVFKAAPGADLFLYYGQPEVAAPLYDLNLIAGELLNAQPEEAKLGIEEALKTQPWWEVPLPSGGMRYLFWAVMGLVVVGLLVVIARLLPEEQ